MIYLVRHGQTEFNLARRYQGALDSPLTDHGVRQAERVGRRLRILLEGESGWELVASPQGRARRTAEIVNAALGLPMSHDPRLREISLGEWDSLAIDEVVHKLPPGASVWERQLHAPGGEPFEAIAARVGEWLAEVDGSGRRIVAVSHGMAGRVLRGLYGGLSRQAMLELDVPQDAVFRLADGRIERIGCPAEASAAG
ncbi:MAG: histidine phosphatase family protein [Phenylobacterium sp.]|uniref:histidine phosphatase family protein n=1 Tax=Phenylobacterium sp. TaxID=1871053 RepID=UPI002A35F981|nr:histidine phosphatase family protein [Phenylobacterium sp.]MDX9999109.1 histidine phosphatase family protein [Phenylobacterium sp.]